MRRHAPGPETPPGFANLLERSQAPYLDAQMVRQHLHPVQEKVEVADSEVAAVAANDPQEKKVHILSWPAFRKARLHTSAQRGRLLLPTAAGLSLVKSRDLVVNRDKLGTFRQIAARTAAWSGPMGAGQRASEASAELQERDWSSVLLGISILHRPNIWPNSKSCCNHKPIVAMAFICRQQVA